MHLPGKNFKSLANQMFLDGFIISGNNSKSVIKVDKVLCDSGALHGSYISKEFLDKIRHTLSPAQIKKVDSKVRLGDNVTVVSISEVIILDLIVSSGDLLNNNEDKEYEVKEVFCVIPTGPNIIIGLPTIVRFIPDLFKIMVDNAVKVYQENLSSAEQTIENDNLINTLCELFNIKKPETIPNNYFDDLEPLWENIDLEAPEDLETDLPVNFEWALHFMEVGYEESLKEYLSLFESHIKDYLREHGRIINILETKGVKVFVPQNWNGINIDPIELTFSPDMPSSMRVQLRPVNKLLFEHAYKEFLRLRTYQYVDSTSPIVSNLVIAPKATKPFIRFCGDYVLINKHIIRIHAYIPNVQHELAKIQKFKIFLDLDMANAFHQFKLGPKTSEYLSVLTPWGCVKPLFLPEGVPPATAILHDTIRNKIFADFEEWTICIHDNMLLLAHDIDDACNKLEMFLDRCIQFNIYLKFSKSWFGFEEVKFFGYVCSTNSYRLDDARSQAIMEIPFPNSPSKAVNTKRMQSFLGAALFFQSFVPNYSDKSAVLNEMVHKSFSWDKTTWKIDYEAKFIEFKKCLMDIFTLFYPNYDLEWILRTDASDYGVGAVLFQVFVTETGSQELQPLFCVSAKFSPQALKWAVIEKEAYGIYFSVKKLAYYLRGKRFILETDHANLVWMEASVVPKIMRWRLFIQSFVDAVLKRIKGKDNSVADLFSRIHGPDNYILENEDNKLLNLINNYFDGVETTTYPNPSIDLVPIDNLNVLYNLHEDNPDNILSKCHGGRQGHWGAQVTWETLNKLFPGHSISFKTVQEYVKSCPTCQKVRLLTGPAHTPMIRHLKVPHPRSTVGMDTITISPRDELGNLYCDSIVNHFTGLFFGRPKPKHDAESAAESLLQYISLYGLFDTLITDPGSDYTSDIITHLQRYLGYAHRFSLVDRHESNGVEPSHKQLLRHLRAICNDERVRHKWSSPQVFPFVVYLMNSHLSSERKFDHYTLTFGSLDDPYYFQLPNQLQSDHAPRYIQELNKNLQLVRSISKEHQDSLIVKRTAPNTEKPFTNYQPGDYVLLDNKHPDNKLQGKWLGPFEVVRQYKNDVTCKDLVSGAIMDKKAFFVGDLKLFEGTKDQAYAQALLDHDQFVIREFLAFRGDPETRETIEFEVAFVAGAIKWLPWSRALFQTIQYEDYCRKHKYLMPLLYNAKEATQRIKEIKNQPITAINSGQHIYLNLRWYSHTWYKTLDLPDLFHMNYVVECVYGDFLSATRKKIYLHDNVFNNKFTVDNWFVYSWGLTLEFVPTTMVLVNKQFVKANKCLKTSS